MWELNERNFNGGSGEVVNEMKSGKAPGLNGFPWSV